MPSQVVTQAATLVRDFLFIGGEMVKPESGSPISFSNRIQASVPIMLLDYYCKLATTFPFE
jgi:hypothetical protein